MVGLYVIHHEILSTIRFLVSNPGDGGQLLHHTIENPGFAGVHMEKCPLKCPHTYRGPIELERRTSDRLCEIAYCPSISGKRTFF